MAGEGTLDGNEQAEEIERKGSHNLKKRVWFSSREF